MANFRSVVNFRFLTLQVFVKQQIFINSVYLEYRIKKGVLFFILAVFKDIYWWTQFINVKEYLVSTLPFMNKFSYSHLVHEAGFSHIRKSTHQQGSCVGVNWGQSRQMLADLFQVRQTLSLSLHNCSHSAIIRTQLCSVNYYMNLYFPKYWWFYIPGYTLSNLLFLLFALTLISFKISLFKRITLSPQVEMIELLLHLTLITFPVLPFSTVYTCTMNLHTSAVWNNLWQHCNNHKMHVLSK